MAQTSVLYGINICLKDQFSFFLLIYANTHTLCFGSGLYSCTHVLLPLLCFTDLVSIYYTLTLALLENNYFPHKVESSISKYIFITVYIFLFTEQCFKILFSTDDYIGRFSFQFGSGEFLLSCVWSSSSKFALLLSLRVSSSCDLSV